ncbi:MAG: hypothetical protein U0J93_09360, partial [Parolsenella sp.]|uniref:hypothetical protein n=1 Tax=Parolsenella sp. TaxID=2083006 RepID=UPI002E79CB9D
KNSLLDIEQTVERSPQDFALKPPHKVKFCLANNLNFAVEKARLPPLSWENGPFPSTFSC